MTTLATMTLLSTTGLDADNTVMNFTLLNARANDLPGVEGQISTMMSSWLNGINPITNQQLASYVSQVIQREDGLVLRLYDITNHLDGSDHGSPYSVMSLNVSPAANGTTPLPSEVAMVVTLEAQGRADAPVETPTTRPKQRRTGRVYFGPLNSLSQEVVSGRVRPNSTFRETLMNQTRDLALDLATIDALDGPVGLGVWSRRDAVVRPLESVSIDNAYDTQRRRGEEASVRVRVPIS